MKKTTSAPVIASSFALGLVALALIIWALIVARDIMIPFVIAVCVWYLINALARGFSRLRLGALALPRFFCFLFAILSFIAGGWLVYTLIINNIADVVAAAPGYQKNFEAFVPRLMEKFHIPQDATVEELLGYFNLAGLITGLAKIFTGIAGKTVVVLFYTGFLLYEQRFFNRKIASMIDDSSREDHVRGILRNIDTKIQRYMAVKTTVSALTGILSWLLLRWFGVDFAAFWGLMAFVLNFIPYIGSLASILLPTAIALIQFGDPATMFAVGASLSVVQLGIGSGLDPRLLGDSLNLSPIFIIFSLAIWGLIWGVPGMFLSIPILTMVVVTLSQFPQTKPIAVLLSKTGDIDGEVVQRKKRKRNKVV